MVVIPPEGRLAQAMALGMPPFTIIEQPIKPRAPPKRKNMMVPSRMNDKGGSIELSEFMNKESLLALSKHMNLPHSESRKTVKFMAVVPANLEAEAGAFTKKLKVKVSKTMNNSALAVQQNYVTENGGPVPTASKSAAKSLVASRQRTPDQNEGYVDIIKEVSSTSSASSKSDGEGETPEAAAERKAHREARSRKRRHRAQRREDRANQVAIAKKEAEAKAAMAKKVKSIIEHTSQAEVDRRAREEAQKAEKATKALFDRRNVIMRESAIQDKKILKERAKEGIKRDLAAFFREAFLDGGSTKIKTIILKKIRSK